MWFYSVGEGCGFIDEDIHVVLVQLHFFNRIKEEEVIM